MTLAARFQKTSEMQRVLEDVVLKAGSDGFAADIVYSTVSKRQYADEISDWKDFDIELMKEAFGKRMRLRHSVPVSEILASTTDDAMALSRWKFYVPEDAQHIAEFFRSAFDFDTRNLGVFLQSLLPGNVGYEEGAIKFIETFFSPASDIASRLKRAEKENTHWDPEQAAAIDRFWRSYEESNGQQSEIPA